MEKTLSIIKPNAIKKDIVGKIINHFEENGLKVSAIKMVHLSQNQCEKFYEEHKERAFFKELVSFMSSHPVILMVLSGTQAIEKNREIMGATNPEDAKPGSLRKLYGDSLGENAVHGSDSQKSAQKEISLFFKDEELF